MKASLIITLVMGLISVNAASAAQHVDQAEGKEKIGIISASDAYNLDELSQALSAKADEKGATSYKILSASGNNRLHGVAEIYK